MLLELDGRLNELVDFVELAHFTKNNYSHPEI